MCFLDVGFFLDRVTIGYLVGAYAEPNASFHLRNARNVEAGPFVGKGGDYLIRRIGFYSIVDVDIGQGVLDLAVAFDNQVKIKHEKRRLSSRFG